LENRKFHQSFLRSLILLFSLGFVLQGCSEIAQMTGQETIRPPCADRVVNRAFQQYGEAKSGLALYFEELNDNRLYQAYYAAWDSRNTVSSVKKCWDRRVSHYNALSNLMGMNRELAQIILINMPDEDPEDMISIYREQYDRVMNLRSD